MPSSSSLSNSNKHFEMVKAMEKVPRLAVQDEKPYAPFGDEYGSNILRLEIGPKKMIFPVHAKRLLDKIPSFFQFLAKRKSNIAAKISGDDRIHAPEENLKTAETRKADHDEDFILDKDCTLFLPEEDPKCWDMLLNWTYHDTIPCLKSDDSSRLGWNWDPYAFYVLADELNIPQLKDRIMTTLQEGLLKTKLWHPIKLLDLTWGRTTPGCGMRRYLVLTLVRNIVVYNEPREPNPNSRFTVSTRHIADVLRKYPELLEGIIDAMRGQDGIKARDPRVVPSCEFHEHWPSKGCAYGKDFEEIIKKDTGVTKEKDEGIGDERKRHSGGEEGKKANQTAVKVKRRVRFKDSVECDAR